MSKQQIHKRLSEEQVIAIFENYLAGEIKAKNAREALGLKKSQFFNLISEYRDSSKKFSLEYSRSEANNKISNNAEKVILFELAEEKKLIEDKKIPIKFYNYSSVKDTLEEKHGIKTSLTTIINRAKANDYYIAKPEKKMHDREVITNLVGELAQHDSSHHLWSPFMTEKLYLITTIDDYSRLMLYADFVTKENTWQHILALKSVFLQYGCPLKYYPDQHSIFRYVKNRDKNRPWNNYTVFTDDVDPQWKQVLNDCTVDITYALSPQAKGKVERPYRWIQERVFRIAAKEKLTTIEELRKVLKELIHKYNAKWVHSTTKEIPIIRFEKALRENKSLFKTFKISKPNQTIDDVFCLRAERTVDSYRKIQLDGIEFKVPNGTPKQKVVLRLAPDEKNKTMKIRFWQDDIFLGEQMEKLENFKIVRF